jgi:hypothetical protein
MKVYKTISIILFYIILLYLLLALLSQIYIETNNINYTEIIVI